MRTRERDAMNYNEALKEKYAHFPQVKRIARHRQVPRHVYYARKEIRTIKDSQKRKYAKTSALILYDLIRLSSMYSLLIRDLW